MRIWFNHWFSAVYHIINLMKEGERDVKVIGSSENPFAVYSQVCDEWYTEPKLTGSEYVDFCVDFCKEHKIDVFIPRRGIGSIVHEANRFEKIGVKLMANGDAELEDVLENKEAAYEKIKSFLPEVIPEYYVASTAEEFCTYYEILAKKTRVCYKLVSDEGARSFRVIDDVAKKETAILEKPGNKISFEDACRVMQSYSFDIPVLLMPYLDGVEISVDCLKLDSEDVIIPRYKINKRYSEIRFDRYVCKLCKIILDELGIEVPINVQFKIKDGQPYLLEINTRMSGGLQLSCKASGINLPALALKKLLSKPTVWQKPDYVSAKTVHIETPVLLDTVLKKTDYTKDEVMMLGKRYGNKKRKYLLVNPLQAKHVPVSPSKTCEMFDALAKRLEKNSGSHPLVIAFAETATAIGAVISARLGGEYIQTTRRVIDNVDWIYFSEEHSHATEQKVSKQFLSEKIENCSSVIFIDDEISTGKTLLNFINSLKSGVPAICGKNITVASVINRLSDKNLAGFESLGVRCEFLVKMDDDEYDEQINALEVSSPVEVDCRDIDYKSVLYEKALPDPGLGVSSDVYKTECDGFAVSTASRLASGLGKNVLVIGTEECMYPAIALGRELEEMHNKNVRSHSTTRSPIGVLDSDGYPAKNGVRLTSFYGDYETFLYNIDKYDSVIVVTDAEKTDRPAKHLFTALAQYGNERFVLVKIGKAFGSYKDSDVEILLKDLTGKIQPETLAEREKKIQSGTHYCEMLPIEHKPSKEYMQIYRLALDRFAQTTAEAVGRLAQKIVSDKGKDAVLVSLARAGIPAGILLARYVKRYYGFDLPHYTISIIRGKGIDKNAMDYILSKHSGKSLQFVDGWTGKGAIKTQLVEAIKDYPTTEADLAVLSDPAYVADKCGTHQDILIASSCLNSTVSGLLSRTVLRDDLIGQNDFHGAVFYRELAREDVSYEFVETVESMFTAPQNISEETESVTDTGMDEVRKIAEQFRIDNVNLIKPGIGEATRVLLRRLPEVLLVHSLNDSEHLGHLYRLAQEKGVEVREFPLTHYKACGIIRKIADS